MQVVEEIGKVDCFDDYSKAAESITATNVPTLLLTSGSKARKLLPEVNHLLHLKAVIIFCLHSHLHEPLRDEYPKIAAVVTTLDFPEIVRLVSSMRVLRFAAAVADPRTVRLMEASVLKGDSPGTADYEELTTQPAHLYLAIVQTPTEPPSEADVLRDLCTLSDCPATTVRREWQAAQGSVVQRLIAVYTSVYCHRQLNRALAEDRVFSLQAVLRSLVTGCTAAHRVPSGTTDLYRGLTSRQKASTDPTTFQTMSRLYQPGTSLFWPALISTSKSRSTAELWAKTGGAVFQLTLHPTEGHPHYDVDTLGWSKYPGESEVLLLPYMHFRVKGVSERSSGGCLVELVELPSIHTLTRAQAGKALDANITALGITALGQVGRIVREIVVTHEAFHSFDYLLSKKFRLLVDSTLGDYMESEDYKKEWTNFFWGTITFGEPARKLTAHLKTRLATELRTLFANSVTCALEKAAQEVRQQMCQLIQETIQESLQDYLWVPKDEVVHRVMHCLEESLEAVIREKSTQFEPMRGFLALLLRIFEIPIEWVGNLIDSWKSQPELRAAIGRSVHGSYMKAVRSNEEELKAASRECAERLRVSLETAVNVGMHHMRELIMAQFV
eukprot:TRINITY_DN32484_c0_g1_i1.p1 TRINITY_DN32484_c0_g1~~TRINITY_DN32484_c0_g1_i1.p1  ORF type:complete len:645 (+),score=98.95 TRINITY_DN32484_c0_g1_i1:99-1937(+)